MKKKKTVKKVKPPKLTKEQKKEQKKEQRERELYQWAVRNLAESINRGYRALEKAGLEGQSQSYKTIEHYAVSDPNGKGKHFIVDYAKGTVRVSGSTKNMTVKEMKEYYEVLSQILKHKTRNVAGVKKTMKKSYEEAKRTYQFKGTQEQYERVWETYKNNVEPDKRQKLNSELVMAVLEYSDIYKMTAEDINAAFSYLNRADDLEDAYFRLSEIQDALEIVENYTPEEAAKIFEEKNYQDIAWTFPTLFNKLYDFMSSI